MSETRIVIRLLQTYFPRNWEFGSGLSKLYSGKRPEGIEEECVGSQGPQRTAVAKEEQEEVE
jgi:hypothetical protein